MFALLFNCVVELLQLRVECQPELGGLIMPAAVFQICQKGENPLALTKAFLGLGFDCSVGTAFHGRVKVEGIPCAKIAGTLMAKIAAYLPGNATRLRRVHLQVSPEPQSRREKCNSKEALPKFNPLFLQP
jgi:hypothetical protein